MDQFSYAFGVVIGNQILNMSVKQMLNLDDFYAAVTDLFNNNELKIDSKMSNIIVNSMMNAVQNEKVKEEGLKFLEENKKNPDIHCTSSGLQYQVISEGTGRKPVSTDKVNCTYNGTFINGTAFDQGTTDFRLDQVIKGWTEGLQLMSEGSKYKFFIPYELAYGSRGIPGAIPGYSVLIFDVELIKIL